MASVNAKANWQKLLAMNMAGSVGQTKVRPASEITLPSSFLFFLIFAACCLLFRNSVLQKNIKMKGGQRLSSVFLSGGANSILAFLYLFDHFPEIIF